MQYKKIIGFNLAVLFLLAILLSSNTSAQLKIGLISTVTIANNYSEMIEVQKQLQELQEKHQIELRDMEQELKTKSERFESQSLLLSEEKKKQMQSELEDLYRKGLQYQQEVFGEGGTLAKKHQELTGPVFEKINEMIDKVASEENFDLIFDIINMGVLYSNPDKTEDITQKVLDELNKTTSK